MAMKEAYYQITEESELRELERTWELARHDEATALYYAQEEGFKKGFEESFKKKFEESFKEEFGENFKEKLEECFKEALENALEREREEWRGMTINRNNDLERIRAALKRRWEQKRCQVAEA